LKGKKGRKTEEREGGRELGAGLKSNTGDTLGHVLEPGRGGEVRVSQKNCRPLLKKGKGRKKIEKKKGERQFDRTLIKDCR